MSKYPHSFFRDYCECVGNKEKCLEYIKNTGGKLFAQIKDGGDNIMWTNEDKIFSKTGVYGVANLS